MPREVLTSEQRQELNQKKRNDRRDQEYRSVWGKLPGVPLSAEEFAKGHKAFRAWVRSCHGRGYPLYWPVDFVRKHYHDIDREEREKERNRQSLEERLQHIEQYERMEACMAPILTNAAPAPRVGRNEPCPCGSGRKFKKCCGR